MKHKQDPERRSHERVELSSNVELFHEGSTVGSFGSVDVSEGGMQIRGFPLPMLSRVKVFVQLPTRPALLLDGVVAWRTIGRSGIRFVDLTPPAQAALRQLGTTD